METLDGTEWDVVISGTGLPQSLLALALSRSDKKVLHVDRNEYYGGDEAALSLSEAETWAARYSGQGDGKSSFRHAVVLRPADDEDSPQAKLSHARAYSLALAPHLIYAKSPLLQAMVSSRTHSQLEFQAVGSWFIVDDSKSQPSLTRVPGGREDVFKDDMLDLRARRSLMKFLRFVTNYEEQHDTWEEYRVKPFSTFLQDKFGLPPASHAPINALSMSSRTPEDTSVEFAVPRIARYLTGIGLFGPGFGAVLPKWGGLAEVGQVACRACAVGGGVYVLGKAITGAQSDEQSWFLQLSGGEKVTTRWLAGTQHDLPDSSLSSDAGNVASSTASRNISIVSSPLTLLFPPTSEGGVTPAGAVVLLGSAQANEPPIHILIHSSESGECSAGQCVLYASTAQGQNPGFERLAHAVQSLLQSAGEPSVPQVLWTLQYEQQFSSTPCSSQHESLIPLQPLSPELVLEDGVLQDVKTAWQRIAGADPETFLKFEAREGMMEDDAE